MAALIVSILTASFGSAIIQVNQWDVFGRLQGNEAAHEKSCADGGVPVWFRGHNVAFKGFPTVRSPVQTGLCLSVGSLCWKNWLRMRFGSNFSITNVPVACLAGKRQKP